ncbi:MAG: glycosyltransferase family A protein [Desulfurococcaceae archaeon]
MVIARDEGEDIRACLESLKNQTLKPFLVVVNDGSLDNTGDIALEYADVVVSLPRHEESWAGRPELASVFNAGFSVVEEMDLDYLLVSGADTIYPSTYLENITSRMREKSIVLASGIVRGERSSWMPRGTGRVIDARWFRSIGFRYPLNYGFEAYLVYKALSEGRGVAVFSDLIIETSRKTVLSKEKMYLWGKGMKALNYWWPYAFGRSLLVGIKSPSSGLALIKGYLSRVDLYEDIKDFTPRFQKQTLIRRVKNLLGRECREA